MTFSKQIERSYSMPITRHIHNKNYVIIPNSLLRDDHLSMREIGLLCYMISMPNDWEFSVSGLEVIIPNDGRQAIQSSLKRIEEAGYLRRSCIRDPGGKIAKWLWEISDTPDFLRSDADRCSPDAALPHVAEHHVAKRPQTKNIINKENKAKTAQQQFSPVKKNQLRWVETGVDEDGLSIGYWEGLEDWRDLC